MFFKKVKNEKKLRKVEGIFVVKTEIVSSYNNGQGCGPMMVTQYFLATKENGEFRELFSGVKLGKNSEMECFDTPYVVEEKPLKEYLKKPLQSFVNNNILFDFILTLNTIERLKMMTEVEEEAE